MSERIFLHYTRDDLDRAYDQRAWAPNVDELMARWRDAVQPARAAHPRYRDVPYGSGAEERLDLYPAAAIGAPVHIHIHGGAWRSQAKEDAAFAAPVMTAAGVHYVVPEFGKLPGTRMPDVVDQLARAVRWVVNAAPEFGGDRGRIVLSGHSSGAHLAAVLATLDWTRYGLPPRPLAAVVCISGAYDLEAVLLSARRAYISLTPEEADRLSPPRHADRVRCPVTVIHGDRETPEFIRQAYGFADALRREERLAEHVVLDNVNHFEAVDLMADPASAVYRAIIGSVAGLSGSARAVRQGVEAL